MILSTLTAIRLWFTRLPDGLRVMLIMAVAIVALFVVTYVLVSQRDARVIERHEDKREAAAAPAREKAAEDRAQDAIDNMLAEQARELEIARAEASEAAGSRPTQPPHTRAFICAAMREDYTAAELAKLKVYQEVCL